MLSSRQELGRQPVLDDMLPFEIQIEQILRGARKAEEIASEWVRELHRRGVTEEEILAILEAQTALGVFDWSALGAAYIESLHDRLRAQWSFLDVVEWTPLVSQETTPVLRMMTMPLGKPHKKHQIVGEEHNLSGIHFHYTQRDGRRSDILFAFGSDPQSPEHPVKWERHGTKKAKFHPRIEEWGVPKRENINEVCCAARDKMAEDSRFFHPSKEALYLLPI